MRKLACCFLYVCRTHLSIGGWRLPVPAPGPPRLLSLLASFVSAAPGRRVIRGVDKGTRANGVCQEMQQRLGVDLRPAGAAGLSRLASGVRSLPDTSLGRSSLSLPRPRSSGFALDSLSLSPLLHNNRAQACVPGLAREPNRVKHCIKIAGPLSAGCGKARCRGNQEHHLAPKTGGRVFCRREGHLVRWRSSLTGSLGAWSLALGSAARSSSRLRGSRSGRLRSALSLSPWAPLSLSLSLSLSLCSGRSRSLFRSLSLSRSRSRSRSRSLSRSACRSSRELGRRSSLSLVPRPSLDLDLLSHHQSSHACLQGGWNGRASCAWTWVKRFRGRN